MTRDQRFVLLCFSAAIMFLIMATGYSAGALSADDSVHCHVVPSHEPSPAEKAYLAGQTGQAESFYRESLRTSPHDPALIGGLVRSLLRQQKVDDASSLINSELASAPKSVVLLTALGEVEYRQGKIAEAAATADQGLRIDPCHPRLYLKRA